MAVIKKNKPEDGGGGKKRRKSHGPVETLEDKIKYDPSAAFKLSDVPQEEKVAEKHPLELWTHEQVMGWANEALKERTHKHTKTFIASIKMDGAALYQVDRQWMITNNIKAKEKVTATLEELKKKLTEEKLKKEREALRKEMLNKKEKGEWDASDDEEEQDKMERKLEAKRQKLRELWQTPKSIRDMTWFRQDLQKIPDRIAAEETARFRVMEKLSKFEKDRLEVEKFTRKLQKERDFYRLAYPEQCRVLRARKAVQHLLVQLKPSDETNQPQKPRNFSKYSYIRNRFVQEARAKRRPKCKPELTLRVLNQRLPENEQWKVRWLMKEGDFTEYDAIKSLVDNRYFLSAAHSQLMKTSRRTEGQSEMIEKYSGFLRTVDIFRKITDDAIEEICCALEEKEYGHGNRIVTENKNGQNMYILYRGRIVASRLVYQTGISKPQLVKEFTKSEYWGIKQPYQFDATSIQNTVVLSIRRDLIESIIGTENLKNAAPGGESMADRMKGGGRSKSQSTKKRKKKKKKRSASRSAQMTGNKWLGGDDEVDEKEQDTAEQSGTKKLKRKVSFAGLPDSEDEDDMTEATEEEEFAGWGGGGTAGMGSSMTIRDALGF